uniref:putative RING-H2 finger protein ATL71 n=1 Tax=Erigeron canadensis TaxID=72917 RepID=UPI001CB8B98F|nr:putative RING-H2 finger protein ATL71 [Erigeron canadensis]
MDTGEPSYRDGTIPYGLGLFLILLFLLIALCYSSYIYKRRTPQPAGHISFITTINNYHTDNNHHHSIRIPDQTGSDDDDVLIGMLQTYVYSELLIMKQLHRRDASSCCSGCTICLADYEPADVIHLLPECGHFFHAKCIDTWLKVHPTCPVCRKSPLPILTTSINE